MFGKILNPDSTGVKLILRKMHEKVIGPTKIEQIFRANMAFYVFMIPM